MAVLKSEVRELKFGSSRVHFGPGSVLGLETLVRAEGPVRCLVVHGGRSYQSSGAKAAVDLATLRIPNVKHIQSEPHRLQIETVARQAELLRNERWDLIIGVGGGSTLDLAKCISVLIDEDDLARLDLRTPSLQAIEDHPRMSRLVLIPTTAGTGSELTPFATVWDGLRKHSLESPHMVADHAFVDPVLTRSCSLPVAVSAAADALCQCIESYWSIRATKQSKAFAREAIELTSRSALSFPQEPSERLVDLSLGALLGGAAIAISRTTAAHAASYALTAVLGVPHGAAALINLPWVTRLNGLTTADNCISPWGVESVHRDVSIVTEAVVDSTGRTLDELVPHLLAAGGFPPSMIDLADPARWQEPWIAYTLGNSRMLTNPRAITKADMLEVTRGMKNQS